MQRLLLPRLAVHQVQQGEAAEWGDRGSVAGGRIAADSQGGKQQWVSWEQLPSHHLCSLLFPGGLCALSGHNLVSQARLNAVVNAVWKDVHHGQVVPSHQQLLGGGHAHASAPAKRMGVQNRGDSSSSNTKVSAAVRAEL
jgi:hypothetical protein